MTSSAKRKLSPQELEDKRARDQIKYLRNRITSAWLLGHIKSRYDLYRLVWSDSDIVKKYFKSELEQSVCYADVHDFCTDLSIELETSIWLRNNPPPPVEPTTAKQELEVTKVDVIQEFIQKEEEKHWDIPECKGDKSFLFWFQKKALWEFLQAMKNELRANLLVAPTGSGKTFIMGALLCRLKEWGWHCNKTMTPWPYIYVTKASVVEQTKRVFKQFFSLDENDVLVINIDQLRSQFGKRFVREELRIVDGEEKIVWKWRKNIPPAWIGWDECQCLKNHWSKQSQVAQSYNEIEDSFTYQAFISATPFTRVSEAKCFSVATRVPYTFGVQRNAPLSNEHWSDFAKNIASNFGKSDTKPEDNSEAAIDRLMDYLDRYVIRVKGIKYQFKARNSVQLIDFVTKEGREFYYSALERFLKKKAEAEGDETLSKSQKNICILVALLVFRIAAESNPDRVKMIADAMYDAVMNHKQAACAAVNFKVTIVKIVDYLVNVKHVPRELISLVWGGAPVETKKQKLKKGVTGNDALTEMLKSEGITLEDLDLDEVEDALEVDPTLKLKPQNAKQRQIEIDNFQKGKSLYCLYTFRAGGVGLSLHHTDELTKEKVRHKESGYAFEEDIPLIPTRQRICFVAPTYSAIELVQGLGRCPRLTSLSDTPQVMMFFRGTIEEKVARIVSRKLRCLTKVVRNKESWEDVILERNSDEAERIHLNDNTPDDTDDDGIPTDVEPEEEVVEV